jgi:hypothetical protein
MRSSTVTLIIAGAFLTGCGGPLFMQKTEWPGSGVGKIEAKGETTTGPTVTGPGGSQASVMVPISGALIMLPLGRGGSRHFDYYLRDKNGTIHVVQSTMQFEVGDCLAFSGYADGPSRTYWTRDSVNVELSNQCQK